MDEFFETVVAFFLAVLIFAAILIPAWIFECDPYVVIVEADECAIGELSLSSGNDAKVWITDYEAITESQYCLLVEARGWGGDNDIKAWLDGYNWQLIYHGED